MRFPYPESDDPFYSSPADERALAERHQALRDHRERIRPFLPPALQPLQQADVHDAQVWSLRIDPAQRTLQLCVYHHDSEKSYQLKFDYRDIQLTTQETSLLCLIASDRNADVYWGEVDLDERTNPPVYIHRLLWQTRISTGRDIEKGLIYTRDVEIEFRFGGFELEIMPNPDGDFSRPADFITIVRADSRTTPL